MTKPDLPSCPACSECGSRLDLDSGGHALNESGRLLLKWAVDTFDPGGRVVSHSERDETGICYEVQYETFKQIVTVWHRRVLFGLNDGNVAGGHFFVIAAQDQAGAAEDVYQQARALTD